MMIRRRDEGESAVSCAAPSIEPCSATSSTSCAVAIALKSFIAAAISRAPGRKHRMLPPLRGSRTSSAAAIVSPGAYSIVSGCSVPGTSITGQLPRNAATGPGSSVADMTTMWRSGRASQACLDEREAEIGVHAALVKLIDDDRRDVAEERVLLQVGGEDAFGDDQQLRVVVNWRSKRMCHPISRPTVQPRSAAMRRAIARAATRLGCKSRTRPRSTSAGGTRVVLPAPGAATSTAARWRSARRRSGAGRNQLEGPATRSIIKAYRQGYSAFAAQFGAATVRVEKHPGT